MPTFSNSDSNTSAAMDFSQNPFDATMRDTLYNHCRPMTPAYIEWNWVKDLIGVELKHVLLRIIHAHRK